MDEKTREAIREMLKRRAEARTQTPAMARQWLIEEGLYNDAGELRPQYGGQGEPEDEP
jgi:hypothetical protein